MELINYINESKPLKQYCELIGDIYKDYPLFLRSKIEEIKKTFNHQNPFLKFGQWKNLLLLKSSKPVAHICAVIDKRLPTETGLVGYFDSINDFECAKTVFDAAIEFLVKQRKKTIKGPINLTTWRGFRISYPEKNKPFFLEPFTRAYYRELFENYGFSLAQKNISTIQLLTRTKFLKFKSNFQDLKRQGFTFEELKTKNLISILPEIYGLALESLANTWSFVKISWEEFMYYFKNLTDPGRNHFLYIVRNKDKQAIGFFWGAIDLYARQEKRMVLKTMGVVDKYQSLGIGRALFYLIYQRAKQRGVTKLIFSTMRADNDRIKKITGSKASIYRQYAVYELKL